MVLAGVSGFEASTHKILVAENRLSPVYNPAPSAGRNYGKWLGDSRPLSFHQRFRRSIDVALEQKPPTFDDFPALMPASGCVVDDSGKHLKLLAAHEDGPPDQRKYTRCDTLAKWYMLPTVASLRADYAAGAKGTSDYQRFLRKKKKAYTQYRQAKAEMRELVTAKANCDGKLIAPLCNTESTTGAFFTQWFRKVFVKAAPKGCTAIMDNASFHPKTKLKNLARRHGIKLLFLPPYSPDFNPIEKDWANVKRALADILLQKQTLDKAIYRYVEIRNCYLN